MAMSVSTRANPSNSKNLPCDCAFCENNSIDQPSTAENPYQLVPKIDTVGKDMPETGKELVRQPTREEDSYGSSLDSEADKKDQMIRQAPYLPEIQIWARKDGPYTLKVGDQWFHCDDLTINDQEYRRQSKPSTRYQPQQISSRDHAPSSNTRPSRPQVGRTASQQMMQNAKSARDTEDRRRRRDHERSTAPPAKESDRRRDSVSRTKDEDDYFRDRDRERGRERQPDHDRGESLTTSQVQWPEPRRSNDSVTAAAPQPQKQSRPQMPRRTSRRSAQDGGILVPVRSKGKRVRFATNT